MNILTRMRNVQLAYHYETLSNSLVILDPLKEDIVSYKKDANALVDELEQSLAKESSDPQGMFHSLRRTGLKHADINQESTFTGFASQVRDSPL